MDENKKFQVLDVLKEMKVATANQVAKEVKIHYFTAEKILDDLANGGTIDVQRNLVGKYVKKYYMLKDQTSTEKKRKVNKDESTKVK